MKYILTLLLASSVALLQAQETPKHTNDILKEAYQQAAKEKKNVFVIFHASWCGWCHKMDTAMNDKLVKKFFDDNYVIRHLVVHEAKDKKHLENPGAMDLLAKYKGQDQGIPFWLIFDKNGRLLADSQMRPAGAGPSEPGKNTGCPASEEEVAHFIRVLETTSPLNAEQLAIVKARFLKNAN
ncbi:MAG TPA: thioredoxin family protein [Chitinophagaceae bacterium]|nr:thioredoxin family protein [Chitinophagaceae bacterium]